MSEENTQPQAEETQPSAELAMDDLENVAGGGCTVETTNIWNDIGGLARDVVDTVSGCVS